MSFDQKETGDEVAFDHGGLQVVVDHASAPLLDGLKVDYLMGLDASGFKIYQPQCERDLLLRQVVLGVVAPVTAGLNTEAGLSYLGKQKEGPRNECGYRSH